MKVAALLLLAACGFSKLPKLAADASGGSADAGPCTGQYSDCVNMLKLRTCSGAGATPVETTCNWQCVGNNTAARCGLLAPTGGSVTAADADPTSFGALSDVTIADTTIDPATGSITGVRAGGNGVVSGIDFRFSPNGVGIFRMQSVRFTGYVQILGSHPVAFVTNTALTVGGQLDVRGDCTTQVSPGGGAGGAANMDATGMGGGSAGTSGGGGGGGGNGLPGAMGGLLTGGFGGTSRIDNAVTLLVGGGGGGGGTGAGASGGHGGGAIQLVTNGALTINMGNGINAGACGGHGASSNGGGGGGGAGGTIVLEGTPVTIFGWLTVNGGGGGGGGNGGGDGANANPSRDISAGGTSTTGSTGGNGGSGPMTRGTAGASGTSFGGGGGGSIGRIRVNTVTGVATIDPNAVLSPAPTDSSTTFSQGAAAVQ